MPRRADHEGSYDVLPSGRIRGRVSVAGIASTVTADTIDEARAALTAMVSGYERGIIPPLPVRVRQPAERFWPKVDKSGDCWEWLAARDTNGYGQFIGPTGQTQAHRFAYELEHGPIPAGMYVCHRCDNPGCVRPAHLFVGTQADNMADMRAKGRQSRAPSGRAS